MKKDNKKMKIIIQGNEKSKSEIVYNNVVNNMESMDLSKDKQIDYLLSRINFLETDLKNKIVMTIIISLNLIIMSLGLLFMYLNVYILGIVFCLISFVLVIFLVSKFKNNKIQINNEFKEIENIRKSLNSKLK